MRRIRTIEAFRDAVAGWPSVRSEYLPIGAPFAPAVELRLADGPLATVSAHANGFSVLIGVTEELHDLDDLEFEDALREGLSLVASEYHRRTGNA